MSIHPTLHVLQDAQVYGLVKQVGNDWIVTTLGRELIEESFIHTFDTLVWPNPLRRTSQETYEEQRNNFIGAAWKAQRGNYSDAWVAAKFWLDNRERLLHEV